MVSYKTKPLYDNAISVRRSSACSGVLPALDIVVAHQTPGSETGTHPAFWKLLETLTHAKCAKTPC